MNDHLLDDIIQLEKALQSQLQEEQERIQVWLQQEKALLEPQLEEPEQEATDQFRDQIDQARIVAEQEAAAERQRVAERCKRLEDLPENWLKQLLTQHLQGVLPESEDDCQDGQG